MTIRTVILIILALYGIGTTIAFIIYLIKYLNLSSKYNINNNKPLCNVLDPNIIDPVNSSISDIEVNNTILNGQLTEEEYLDLIQSYDIYNNADFYNQYDLLDEYDEKIMIYSKDLKNCYLSCELINNCYGFSKYNNYCYLKGKYDLNQKNNVSKITLVVKKNNENNINNTNLVNNNENNINNTNLVNNNENNINNTNLVNNTENNINNTNLVNNTENNINNTNLRIRN
jgi:hypothetical protein